jgi:hypothetical protein
MTGHSLSDIGVAQWSEQAAPTRRVGSSNLSTFANSNFLVSQMRESYGGLAQW